MNHKENYAVPFGESIKNLMKKYPAILIAVLIHILLRVIISFPFLYALKQKSYTLLYGVISIGLYIIVIAPLRCSFAYTMEQASRAKGFDIVSAFSYKNYFEKLLFQIKYFLKLFIFLIPVLAVLTIIYYFNDTLDFVTNSRNLRMLGESIFGKDAGIVEGGYSVIALVTLTSFVFVFGIMRNSANRYLRMSPISYAVIPDAEIRRCLIKRRGAQFLFSILNFVLLLPSILPILFSWMQEYAKTQNLVMFLPSVTTVEFYQINLLIVGLTYLLLLPLRRSITASFAADCRYRRENEKNTH